MSTERNSQSADNLQIGSPITSGRRRRGSANSRAIGKGNTTPLPPPSTPLTTTITRVAVATGHTRNSPHFRLSRIRHLLRGYSRARSIAPIALLACAVTLEFVLSEIIHRAGGYAREQNRRRLSNRHIMQALQSEDLPWVPTLFPPRRTTIPAAGAGLMGANFDLNSQGRSGIKTKTKGKGNKRQQQQGSKKSRRGKGGKR